MGAEAEAQARLAEGRSAGHTIGMKTAISIPDELAEQTDELARRMHKSRSRVVAEALGEYVARHDPEAITSALDQVVDKLGHDHSDAFTARAAQRRLEDSDW